MTRDSKGRFVPKGKPVTYERIVFMQSDDYEEFEREVEAMTTARPTLSWIDAAVEYLALWDTGDGGDTGNPAPARGTLDSWAEVGDYALSWNERMGYVGLERIER